MNRIVRRGALVELAGEGPPSEFRVFAAGINASTNGDLLYDEHAEAAVLAAFAAHGVDLMLDLEHASLDSVARGRRTDAADARGWFRLEARAGELWAVGVTWTPDGVRRLRERTQRYISPACYVDDEGRPIELINAALCAMPATHGATPLVRTRMNPEQVSAALDALIAGDHEAAAEILKALIASAAGAESPAAPEPVEPASEDPAAEEVVEDASEPASEDPAAEEDEDAAMATRGRDLVSLTGAPSLLDAMGAAVAELRALRADVARRDETERRGLVRDLVALGAELPVTAWVDPLAASPVPCARLSAEGLPGLRARVSALRAARPATVAPPAEDPLDLTAAERAAHDSLPAEKRAKFLELRARNRKIHA